MAPFVRLILVLSLSLLHVVNAQEGRHWYCVDRMIDCMVHVCMHTTSNLCKYVFMFVE